MKRQTFRACTGMFIKPKWSMASEVRRFARISLWKASRPRRVQMGTGRRARARCGPRQCSVSPRSCLARRCHQPSALRGITTARLTQKLGDAVSDALAAGRRRGGPRPFGELCRRGAIDDRRNDAGRQEGEGSEEADVPFAQGLTLAISAKDALRPSRISSIHPRALAMAVSRASRFSGLIASFAQGV
jgi:hypothetical protein